MYWELFKDPVHLCSLCAASFAFMIWENTELRKIKTIMTSANESDKTEYLGNTKD